MNSITFMIGIKDYNVGWLVSVTNNYLSESLPTDVFREIKNMLDVVEYVKTDKGGYHRHSTAGLFQTISARMRNVHLDEVIIPAEQELIESIRRTRTTDRNYDKDGERPFFKTWSRNTNRGRVEAHNLEKTKRVFGKDIENHCRKNNISSVWSSAPIDRSLLLLLKHNVRKLAVARYIKEEEMFVKPKMRDLPDGSLMFEVTLNHDREFLNWVYQYGLNANKELEELGVAKSVAGVFLPSDFCFVTGR